MARLNPARSLGQLLIIGFDGVEMSPRLASLLTRLQPAGVILFARNIQTAPQTHQLLKACQAAVADPLFTAVDLEGGRVDRFREAIGPTPSAADVFLTADRRLFRRHGEIIGENCRALGFNTDLAPVLDLAFERSRKVMSSRAVSDDPKQAAIYAREFLAGLKSAGVIGCGKHFPGLGEAQLDTHFELPSVSKTWKKLWDEDLYPYRVMRNQFPMVLVGHASYPSVSRQGVPASLSKKWITDILRQRIGYRGLILSDDLEMHGVLKAAPIEQAAVEFIRAGGDLALVCHEEEHIERCYEALVKQAERDSKFAARAQDCVRRVLAFKTKHKTFSRIKPAPAPTTVGKLSRRLWEFTEQVRLKGLQQASLRQERA